MSTDRVYVVQAHLTGQKVRYLKRPIHRGKAIEFVETIEKATRFRSICAARDAAVINLATSTGKGDTWALMADEPRIFRTFGLIQEPGQRAWLYLITCEGPPYNIIRTIPLSWEVLRKGEEHVEQSSQAAY